MWKCIVERACVVMVFFSSCSSSLTPASVWVCVSLLNHVWKQNHRQSHFRNTCITLFCIVFLLSTFGSSSFLLKQVYVISHPLPLSLFVRDPYHMFYQGGYQLVVHPQSVMLQFVCFFLILLFCFLGHIAHTVHAFVIKKTGNEGTQM